MSDNVLIPNPCYVRDADGLIIGVYPCEPLMSDVAAADRPPVQVGWSSPAEIRIPAGGSITFEPYRGIA